MTTAVSPPPLAPRQAFRCMQVSTLGKLCMEYLAQQPRGAIVTSKEIGTEFGLIAARVAEAAADLRRMRVLVKKKTVGDKAIDLDEHHLCLEDIVWRSYNAKQGAK